MGSLWRLETDAVLRLQLKGCELLSELAALTRVAVG